MADDDPGQEDLDDLGDLGDGTDPEDDDTDVNPQTGEDGEPLTPEQITKLRAKVKRQEDRISRLLAAQAKGQKPAKKDDADQDDSDDDAPAGGWRMAAAQGQAAAQLAAAGFSGTAKQSARLTRLLDLAAARPDRHGVFDFEDEIEDLKEEYPTLFGGSFDGARPPRVRTAPARTAPPKKDPTQRTSDAMLKAAGYR